MLENQLPQHTDEGQPASYWFMWMLQILSTSVPPLETYACSSLAWPQGCVALTFTWSPADCEANYLLCSKTWLDPCSRSRIDSPSNPTLSLSLSLLCLPLFRRLVNVAQRRSIPADLIKRVAYEATTGCTHTVTPAITTSSTVTHISPNHPQHTHKHPPNLSAQASRLAWFICNNSNKSGNNRSFITTEILWEKRRDVVWIEIYCLLITVHCLDGLCDQSLTV